MLASGARGRVCVIGAGAAGLVTAKTCQQAGLEVEVFEASPHVGGTWFYTESTGPGIHSSMYAGLRTNLPKEIMAFSDCPFPKDLPSFLSHQSVQSYLTGYSDKFGLDAVTKLNTRVTQVTPTQPQPDARTWTVTFATADGQPEERSFDFVAVCNGHYSRPYVPELKGIERFAGETMHTHDYRKPDAFSGKRICVLGAGASGRDIAIELASVADAVYLCHRGCEGPIGANPMPTMEPATVFERPAIAEVGASSVIFSDGSEAADVDVLIWATGYHFTFPFLSEACGVSVVAQKHVQPLYQHAINITHPTMAFVGIPWKICPFILFEAQARLLAAAWCGAVALPSAKEMHVSAAADLKHRTETLGWPERHAHKFGALQWEYHAELARLAKATPLPAWRQDIYNDVHTHRSRKPARYRDCVNYNLDEEAESWRVRLTFD